jgi:hypothetical protein
VLALAALMLAAASPDASATPALTSTSPWWEKFTFTMSGDGSQQSCNYETSLAGLAPPDCGGDSPAPMRHSASAGSGYTKITIERRFTPGDPADPLRVQTGDTLLGGQVLALAIDQAGSVRGCQIVKSSGEMTPPYGCDDAKTERFDSSGERATAQVRHGFMTVLVYGHEEYPV